MRFQIARLHGLSTRSALILSATSSVLLSLLFVASASQSAFSKAAVAIFACLAVIDLVFRGNRLVALSNFIVLAFCAFAIARTLIVFLPMGAFNTAAFFLACFALPALLAVASINAQLRASDPAIRP